MSWEVITVLIGNMQCIWLEEPNDRVWDNHSTWNSEKSQVWESQRKNYWICMWILYLTLLASELFTKQTSYGLGKINFIKMRLQQLPSSQFALWIQTTYSFSTTVKSSLEKCNRIPGLYRTIFSVQNLKLFNIKRSKSMWPILRQNKTK